MFTDDELIKKKDILDPIEDDDDIDWKYNPFDVDLIEEAVESPEQLMSQITFEGSPQLQKRLKALVLEFIDVFATKVRREPAAVDPMKIVIDEDKCDFHVIVHHLVDIQRRSRRRYGSKLMCSWT